MEANTSAEALQAIRPKVADAYGYILDTLRIREGGMTADEVAERIGYKPLFVRPRMSELHKEGKIEKTGKRRKNASGLSATVWQVAQ